GAGSGGAGSSSNTGCGGGGGGGVIIIKAASLNLLPGSLLSADGGAGKTQASNCYSGAGGGSGGTIWLYGLRINFTGSLSAAGGAGGGPGASYYGYGGGGGAGGSLVFLPLTISTLSSGSMNFNGGAGGGGAYGPGYSGGGSGRAGGQGATASTGAGGGAANPGRGISIYNAYMPSGSAFSIISTGSTGTGLAYLYYSPFSGLSWSYPSVDYGIGVFDSSLNPVNSVPVRIANKDNNSQVYFNGTTSGGLFPMAFTGMPSNGFFSAMNYATVVSTTLNWTTAYCPAGSTIYSYSSQYQCLGACGACSIGASWCYVNYSQCTDGCPSTVKTGTLSLNCSSFYGGNSTWHALLVDNMPSSGYIAAFFGNGNAPAHSASYIPVSSGSHMIEIASLQNSFYGPDGIKRSSAFLVNNSEGELSCYGGTLNASADSYCLLVRAQLDAFNTRMKYSEIFTTPVYSAMPQFSGFMVPNLVTVGGSSAANRLAGMASASIMKAGNSYDRVVFYSPQSMSESNFAYQETIPTDFAFGT
ncbi:MAG TPA: hypothetical protein PLO51_04320, partial [Candidatus Micrarchaeota archaeon]|nr:hypothetical protein [Candidatus Micrarchaeota archaeon]